VAWTGDPGEEPSDESPLDDAGIDWADHDDLLEAPDDSTAPADGEPGVDAAPADGESGDPTAPGVDAAPADGPVVTAPAAEAGEAAAGVDDAPGEAQLGAADGGVAGLAGATPPADPTGDGLLGGEGGPEEDVEMPLADHIEEMINRLAVVLLVGGVVALAVFPVADQLINYLWNSHIPGASTVADRRPRLYGPLELPLTEIKIAALAGLLVGLPVLVYQSYRFMRPGLYPRERRYYLAAVPTSLVLASVGVAFAHFVVLPAIFAYFTSYTTGTALVAFGLRETFNLILLLMGYMAVVFQIPLLIQLGIMMGLVSREWLEERRLLFWGGFAGLAFLVSPDPTGMAPIIVAATMIALFEGTLALLRWTGN
jgi:sec-independent protein translocase protein TatC